MSAVPCLSPADLAWLREYFRDTYNEDWSSPYHLDLIGAVPNGVLAWADVQRSRYYRNLRIVGT